MPPRSLAIGFLFHAVAAFAAPVAEPACPRGSGVAIFEAQGMPWAPPGREPSALRGLDRSAVVEYARAWADAYRAAGVDRVVLAPLAADVTSWGAVERTRPASRAAFKRFDFFVTDAIVEAFDGRAVLVLSAECAWDHAGGGGPEDRALFRDYVHALAERYDGDADFGIAENDYDSYPDVDGSGKGTIADVEAPIDRKLAWAAAHRVPAWQVEVEVGEPTGRGDYASVFGDVMAATEDVDAEVWVAPFPADMKQSEFNQRIAPLAAAGGRGPDAVVVSVAGIGNDPTAAKAIEMVRRVGGWLEKAGFASGLLVGDVAFGWRKGAGGCPDDRCGEAMQGEQVAKAIALSAAAGARALVYDGTIERADDQADGTGLASLDPAVLGASPRPRPALAVAQAAAGAMAPGATIEATKVPATTAVRSATCAGEVDVLVWYDWTLEVGPGQPYQDLQKRVRLDLPFESVRSAVLGPGPSFEGATATRTDDGRVEVTLGRTPVLLVSRESGWPVSEASEVAEEALPPDGDGPEVTGETGGAAGGGCGAGPVGMAWPLALLANGLLAALVARRMFPE